MTSVAARLGKVTASLSGRQRALLVIRSVNRGEDPDRTWWEIDDPAQARIFDRCMGYFNVVNHDFNAAIEAIRFHVERLEDLRLLNQLKEGAEILDEESERKADRRAVKSGRKRKNLTAAEYLLSLVESSRQVLLDSALALCAQMTAFDVVVAEISAEFEGEDLRERQLIETCDLIWTNLRALVHELEGPADLPAPDEEIVESIREQIDNSFRFFRLVEPALKRP